MTEAILFSVATLAAFPATRGLGREGRDRLEDLITTTDAVDLTIDFTGVTAMTISFADEFLGKFLTSYDFAGTDTTVKVTGLDPDNHYAVLVCVERRDTQVVVLDEAGRLVLLGDQILAASFSKALELGTFKASDMAAALRLSAPNANNRLKRLTEAGALRKSQVIGSARGGKEFAYEAVTTAVPDDSPLASA